MLREAVQSSSRKLFRRVCQPQVGVDAEFIESVEPSSRMNHFQSRRPDEVDRGGRGIANSVASGLARWDNSEENKDKLFLFITTSTASTIPAFSYAAGLRLCCSVRLAAFDSFPSGALTITPSRLHSCIHAL